MVHFESELKFSEYFIIETPLVNTTAIEPIDEHQQKVVLALQEVLDYFLSSYSHFIPCKDGEEQNFITCAVRNNERRENQLYIHFFVKNHEVLMISHTLFTDKPINIQTLSDQIWCNVRASCYLRDALVKVKADRRVVA